MKNAIALLIILIAGSAQAAPRQVPAGVIDFTQTDAVTASAKSGHLSCYAKTDGHRYCRNSAGVEFRLQDALHKSLLMKDESGSHNFTLQTSSQSASVTLKLPPSDGTIGQAIKTDGNGQLFFDDVNVSGTVPVGGVIPFAGTSAPTGFLACDGSAISRTTYAALFAVIGTSHGQGDGSTTFNLPDYRGRFLRGVDGGQGRDPNAGTRTAMATGGNTGDNVGSLQADEFKSHFHHTARAGGGSAGTPSWAGAVGAGFFDSPSSSAGGDETRPKNAYVNYIIKY